MQEASSLRQTTRRAPPYPLGLRLGVQDVGTHHHAVDTNVGVTCSNGLVQASSNVRSALELTPSVREGLSKVNQVLLR